MDARTPPLHRTELGSLPERVCAVLERDPAVRWAYLFGSAARGQPFRDLDIALVLDPVLGRGAVRFGSLIAELERAVPEVPLDIVDMAGASPALRGSVVQEGRVLLDREPLARKEWEVQVMRIWLDLKPWLAHGEELRLEALRQKAPGW